MQAAKILTCDVGSPHQDLLTCLADEFRFPLGGVGGGSKQACGLTDRCPEGLGKFRRVHHPPGERCLKNSTVLTLRDKLLENSDT